MGVFLLLLCGWHDGASIGCPGSEHSNETRHFGSRCGFFFLFNTFILALAVNVVLGR